MKDLKQQCAERKAARVHAKKQNRVTYKREAARNAREAAKHDSIAAQKKRLNTLDINTLRDLLVAAIDQWLNACRIYAGLLNVNDKILTDTGRAKHLQNLSKAKRRARRIKDKSDIIKNVMREKYAALSGGYEGK